MLVVEVLDRLESVLPGLLLGASGRASEGLVLAVVLGAALVAVLTGVVVGLAVLTDEEGSDVSQVDFS